MRWCMWYREDLFVMEIAEPTVEKTYALYYFEEFYIQPMRLNISFVRTEKMSNNKDPQYVIKGLFETTLLTHFLGTHPGTHL